MRASRITLGATLMLAAASSLAQGISLTNCLAQALQQNASVAIQRSQVGAARANVLGAHAPFDTTISAELGRRRDDRGLRSDEQPLAPGMDSTRTFASEYQLGLSRTLESGIALQAGAGFVSRDDRLERLAGIPAASTGTISFGLILPLGRNRGTIAGAAAEAAQAELDAARAELEQATSATLLEVASAYWDYAAKTRRLEIAVAAYERSSALADELRRMIAADEVPAAEINTALANQAERAAMRAGAQADLADARRRLARAMGLGVARMVALPAPADGFPQPPASVHLNPSAWLDAALDSRPDLRGARLQLEAATARIKGARAERKPTVDLGLELGSNGLRQDTRLASAGAFREHRGASAGATLSFAWPVQNSSADAALLAASSRADAVLAAQREQRDAAATGIVAAAERAERAVDQLHAARDAVSRFRSALDAEQAKRRSGLSTVLDVVGLEERLNNALLSEADLSEQYAIAIAQLRHELALLLHRTKDGSYAFYAADFFQLPTSPASRS